MVDVKVLHTFFLDGAIHKEGDIISVSKEYVESPLWQDIFIPIKSMERPEKNKMIDKVNYYKEE